MLVCGASAKLLVSPAEFAETGIGRLLGRYLKARLGWLAVVAGEIALAVWLLLGAWSRWGGLAACFFGVMSVSYLVWLLRQGEGANCGCFGTGTAVTRKSLARSVLLLAAAAAYTGLAWHMYRVTAVGAAAVGLLLAELLLIGWLSDDAQPWLRQLRLELAGLRRLLGQPIAPTSVRRRVEAQPFWSQIVHRSHDRHPRLVTSWRDGNWYILEYQTTWDETPVTIVAAELGRVHPPWIRMVVLQERKHETVVLATWDSVAIRAPSAGKTRPLTPAVAASRGR